MNLSQLHAVLEVIRCGSVSAAADRLYLTQPAITKQIKALERELKVKLFERAGRGIVPTPAARDMLPHIRNIFHELDSIRATLGAPGSSGVPPTIRGSVHLGCGPVFARTTLPDVIAACRQRHPNIEVVVSECPLFEQSEQLHRGELRLALGTDYLEDANLLFEPLLIDELVLIVPKQHPLARASRSVNMARPRRRKGRPSGDGVERPQGVGLPLAQLRGETIIAHLYVRLIEKSLRRAGISPGAIAHDFNIDTRIRNTETIVAFVARGLGVSLVPGYMMKLLPHDNIAIRRVRERLTIQFGYYHLRHATMNPAEQAFITMLREHVNAHLKPATTEAVLKRAAT